MSQRYDVIVVGAGPAGSVTSYQLARGGAKVLLLDKAKFPRDKPCGGGVTIRAASILPIDITPVVEHEVRNVRFSFRLGDAFVDRSSKVLTYLTQRRFLDEHLAAQAAGIGVDFRDGVAVSAAEDDSDGVTVRAGADVYRANVVVGADGVNGSVATSTGIAPAIEYLVALEGNALCRDGIPAYWEQTIALDLGGLPGGYGWVFPKGEHLNVGVGSWTFYGANLRRKLVALCERYSIDYSGLENFRGYRLPMRVPGSPIGRGNVLLVGDAAGLIDPLSGEGIHSAFLSGNLAANSIISYLGGEASELSTYQNAIDSELMPDLIVSRKVQEIFHRMPAPYMPFLRYSTIFWRAFCELICGQTRYRDFVGKLGPLRPMFELMAVTSRSGALRRNKK